MAVNSALSATYYGISEKRAVIVGKRYVHILAQNSRERLPEKIMYLEENAKAEIGKACQSQKPDYIAESNWPRLGKAASVVFNNAERV